KSPKRVVIFHFGALDMFEALGLSDEVVGFPKQIVPDYLNELEVNDSIRSTGSIVEPNFKIVNELHPDLIIMGARQNDARKEFQKIAPTIFFDLDYNHYIESISKNLKRFGKIYSLTDKAAALNDTMLQNIEEKRKEFSKLNKKGLIVLFNNGKFSAYGPGSRFGFIHSLFGIPPVSKDIAVAKHGNSISSEYIMEQNPDVLFVIDRTAAIGEGHIHKSAVENELVQQTVAYKNGHIIYLTPDLWYLASGGVQSMNMMTDEMEQVLE